jgi:hypothetical protein
MYPVHKKNLTRYGSEILTLNKNIIDLQNILTIYMDGWMDGCVLWVDGWVDEVLFRH